MRTERNILYDVFRQIRILNADKDSDISWLCSNAMNMIDIPPDPQHGREPDKVTCGNCEHFTLVSKHGDKPTLNCEIVGYGTKANNCPCDRFEPNKVKPLAQYLSEYLFHEDHTYTSNYGEKVIGLTPTGMVEILEQALDAYESTEQVKIRIERV